MSKRANNDKKKPLPVGELLELMRKGVRIVSTDTHITYGITGNNVYYLSSRKANHWILWTGRQHNIADFMSCYDVIRGDYTLDYSELLKDELEDIVNG